MEAGPIVHRVPTLCRPHSQGVDLLKLGHRAVGKSFKNSWSKKKGRRGRGQLNSLFSYLYIINVYVFYRSDRSWCLNDKAQNEATVVYKEIKPRSIPSNIVSDTLGVRTARDTTKVIDLKKFNQGRQLEKFPGEIMSADDQCALQYGKNYRQCYQLAVTIHSTSANLFTSSSWSLRSLDIALTIWLQTDCGSLWCTLDGYSCFSLTAPMADGTPCGSRQVSWLCKSVRYSM